MGSKRSDRLAGGVVFSAALVLPIIILLTGSSPATAGFPLDDAWIHMDYGRSIALGGYPAYNPGIPSTGSTAPLWAYILGAIHVLSSGTAFAVWGAKLAGLFFHGLMAWAVYRIVARVTSVPLFGVAVGIFIGCSPPLFAASISGMEISLGCALCLWGYDRYLAGNLFLSGVLLGFSCLARPELAVVVSVVILDLIFRLLKKKAHRKYLWRFLYPLIIIGLLFIGWNIGVDHRPFPATFYAKAFKPLNFPYLRRLQVGSQMILNEAPLNNWIVWIGLFGVVVSGPKIRRAILIPFLAAAVFVLVHVQMIPPIDPRAFYHIRYFLPALPLFWLSISTGAWMLGASLWNFAKGGKIVFGRRLLAGCLGGLALLAGIIQSIAGTIIWSAKYSNDCRNINEVQVELGKAIDRAFPSEAKIASVDAGAIKYFGNRMTIDLMGLNTPDIFKDEPIVADAVVLLPTWIKMDSYDSLKVIGTRTTQNYRVTSSPGMGTQVVLACQSGGLIHPIGMEILGRRVVISLNCLPEKELYDLRDGFLKRQISERRPLP